MPNDRRLRLFNGLNDAGFDIGSYDEFDRRMNNAADRESFFNKVNDAGFDLGSRDEFESKIAPSKYALTVNGKQVPVSEREYKDFVSRRSSGTNRTTTKQPSILDVESKKTILPSGFGDLDPEAGLPEYMRGEAKKRREESYGSNPAAMQQRRRTEQTFKAVRGDQQAAKEVGLDRVNQQLRDRMDYTMATGEELKMPDDGIDYNAIGIAPTVARDEEGNVVTGEDSRPLVGMTTDEVRANTQRVEQERVYQEDLQRQIDEANAELARLQEEAQKVETPDYVFGQDALSPYADPRTTNSDLAAISAARRQTEERIKALQEEMQGGRHGFLSGMMDAAQDPSTWLLGLDKVGDNMTMLTTSEKVKQGKELTKAEQTMLDATIANNEIQQRLEEDSDWLYRAGRVTVDMLPFMAQIMFTGGYGSVAAVGTSMGKRWATAYARKFGEKALLNRINMNILRGFGVGMGDITAGFASANTTGLVNTMNDALQRRIGQLGYDEEGDYAFTNDEDWLRAILKAEVSQTKEFATERFGEHLPGLRRLNVTLAKQGPRARAMARALSGFAGTKAVQKTAQWLRKGGINGVFGEVLEEEIGLPVDVAIGDMTWEDALSGKTQWDIVGGMLMSIGAMHSTGLVAQSANKVYNTAQYYRYKRATDKASSAAAYRMSSEKWTPLRERIDGTTTENMSALWDEIREDGNYNVSEKRAAYDYINALTLMRGYNMGMLFSAKEAAKEGRLTPGKTTPEEAVEMSVLTSGDEGYEAEGPERNEVLKRYNAARQTMAERLGVSDDDVDGELAKTYGDEREIMTVARFTDYGNDLLEYLNARAAYNGMLDRVGDDIEAQVQASNEEVSRITNEAGQVVGATMKADGSQVYVVSGVPGVAETLVVRNAETGELKMIAPDALESIEEPIDAEELRRQREEEITNTAMQQAENEIEGKRQFQPNDVVTLADGRQGQLGPLTPEGTFLLYTEDNKVVPISNDELNELATSVNGTPLEPATVSQQTEQEIEDTENAENYAQNEGENIPEEEVTAEEQKQTRQEAESANGQSVVDADAMPMIGEGEDAEPDFSRAEPERAHRFIYDEAGLSRDEADQFVDANKKEADSALAKLQKKQPKIGTSLAKYRKEQSAWQQQVDEAQRQVDYWANIQSIQKERERAEQELEFQERQEDAAGRQALLDEQRDLQAKIQTAKRVYGDYFDDDFTVPHDVMELVALNMPRNISWEGREGVRGLQQELGLRRGVGRDADSNAFNTYLAKKGEGIGVEQAVHNIWESAMNELPNGDKRYDDSEIRNALLDMFMSAEKPSDIRDYVLNARIAEAEAARAAEDEAMRAAELDAWADAYHLTPEEREDFEDYISSTGEEISRMTDEDIQNIITIFAEQETNTENYEQNRRSTGLDRESDEGRAPSEVEGGEGEILGQGAAEDGGPLAERREVGSGDEVVPGDNVSGRAQVSKSSIQGLERYSTSEVLDIVRDEVQSRLDEAGLDGVSIKDMALHGSRMRGDAHEESDLDVVVEYEGNISEDGLFNILNEEPIEIDGVTVDVNPITKYKSGTLEQYMKRSDAYDAEVMAQQTENELGATSSAEEIAAQEAQVNTEPTEAQKEAGNYQKGHIKVDGYDITIENPKGSVRRGTDANGQPWEVTMNNTYGYIRGTEGVDGDHIDVFLSDNPTSGNVFVVDQVKPDGSFDEHKVMYGFADAAEAMQAYLSNYSPGWKGLGAISGISREEFKKWVESSHRKTKPFREYALAKRAAVEQQQMGQQKPKRSGVREPLDLFAEAERIVEREDKKQSQKTTKKEPTKKNATKKEPLLVNVGDILVADTEENKGAIHEFVDFFDEPYGGKDTRWYVYNLYADKDKYEKGEILSKARIREEDLRAYLDSGDWKRQQSAEIAPAEQLKPTDLRDGVRPESPELGVNEANAKARTDNQGNPVDENGNLIVEKISSIEDLTDDDFVTPSRSVELPDIQRNVRDAIGAGDKPVIIKKNIFEKNAKDHADLTPEQSREILSSALYNPNLYGQNRKATKPYNWVVINTKDAEGKNRIVLLEVNDTKDNVEIVHWHYIRDNALETLKRQAEREGGHILILPSEGSEEGGGLSARTLDLSSGDKDTNKTSHKQEKVKKNAADEKIEDVGEVIAGARKDMSRKLAQAIDNATMQTLTELPFSKAYKKPDLKKAVEEGALREKDAVFYEAWFSTMVNPTKPKVTQREMRHKKYIPDYKTNLEKWVESTHNALQVLRDFVAADEEERDRIIESSLADRYPNREKELAEIEKRKEWNKNNSKLQWGDKTTPNPLWITYEVMKRLGLEVGDKLDIPYGILVANSTGTGYTLENAKGERTYEVSPSTIDEGIDAIVWLAKVKRGDSDIQHPVKQFYTTPTKTEMGDTGRFKVVWGSYSRYQEREFDNKDDAEAFAAKKTSASVFPIREVTRRFGYKVMFRHPLTGEKFALSDEEFDTKDEAMAYIDSNYETLNDSANEQLEQQRQKSKDTAKREITPDDIVKVGMSYKNGKWSYHVEIDKRYANNLDMPLILKDGFSTSKDAKTYRDAIKDEAFAIYKDYKSRQKAITYFDTGADSRIGEDYRGGKDVTAEDFMNAFGFRGVQFGNWTNQRDRQMAVNQAYDAFMDLAKLIGVSPRALSLNGELGIAFGARGVGGFAAHYEPGEIVINLTKTQGAGSLAHEWWHALDNYFARVAGERGGMVTDDSSLAMRPELREAYNRLVAEIRNSNYYKRSKDKGDYWGRMHEVTARLLAEWVDQELKSRGELNTFLSRGAKTDRVAEINYERYKRHAALAGEEVMPFEEFKKLDESMSGSPYPSKLEVERFSAAMRNIFDTIEEREDEETGNTILYRSGDEEVFFSNAAKAVEGIRQDRATPEQWLKMIEKAGGLKAAEDKWTGLSDWLKGQDKKSLTKEEVMDYIRKNQVRVEEVNYNEHIDLDNNSNMRQLREEFDDSVEKFKQEKEAVDAEMVAFNDEMYGKYGEGWSGKLSAADKERGEKLQARYNRLTDDPKELAFNEMVERYGDDFGMAFEVNWGNGKLEPQMDMYGDDISDAAKYFLQFEEQPINSTRLSYTTKGLENKKEIALTVPTVESWNESDEIHFGDAGGGRAVAWVRFGDTTDADGNRVLVIDEIQSKRHQEGRERGYRTADSPVERRHRATEAMNDYRQKMQEKYGDYFVSDDMSPEEKAEYNRLYQEMKDAMAADNDKNKSYDIPEAPFEKNWHELAMKRMLRYAAENGYDKIAWTKGEQQAERYSLSKVFNSVEREDNPSIKGRRFVFSGGNVEDFIVDDNGKVIDSTINDAKGKNLSELVGKDMAVRLMALENGDMVEGEDLRIGGEGMKGFYDQILPRFMDKYGKKWGVKTGEVELPNVEKSARKMWAVDVTPEMKESVMEGQPMFRMREEPAPKKTKKVYKLMRLGEDGLLYPLFIDAAAPTELGVWYDADSPSLDILQEMPSGTFLVDYENGTYTSLEDYAAEHGFKAGKFPPKEAINEATANGLRWVQIEDTKNRQRRYGGESRKYWNLGINGSGTVSTFAMRPGWHAGSLPSMRQIGKGKDKNLRDDNFVWVEGEVSADVNYQQEADRNPDKDIPTHIPENGYYMKATNANAKASQADRIGWYVAGAFKPNRIISDAEARSIIDRYNAQHPNSPVEYDYERESGIPFTEEQAQAANERNAGRYREGEAAPTPRRTQRRTASQQQQSKAYAQRQWRRAHVVAEEAIRLLGLEDRVTVMDFPIGLTGRKAKAKGWYDTKTGKIVVVLNNHRSPEDVLKTILHEGVAHYGLRQLFGEHFDTFLDEVYENATPEIKAAIDKIAAKLPQQSELKARHEATEEYLAKLAEDTDYERAMKQGWWQKIKSAFLDMLHKLGFGEYAGPALTDNELRYILWRSHENLQDMARVRDGKQPLRRNVWNPFKAAEDIVMQEKLQVGNFSPTPTLPSREGEEPRQAAESKQPAMRVVSMEPRNEAERTYVQFKERYGDAVLLMNDGDNYFALGEDALKMERLLSNRRYLHGRMENGRYVLPLDELDMALPVLVRAGNRIAISDAPDGNTVHDGEPDVEWQDSRRIMERLAERYNSKELVFVDLGMSDEELYKILDYLPLYLGAHIKNEDDLHDAMSAYRESLDNDKIYGEYRTDTRKIYIFADRLEPEKAEEAFFHENIHGVLHDWYGDGARTIADRFWDVAPADGKVKKSFVEKKYEPNDRHEELFTYWLSKSMVDGTVDDMLKMFDDADKRRINNLLNIIGYTNEGHRRIRQLEGNSASELQAGRGTDSGGVGTQELLEGENQGNAETLEELGDGRERETEERKPRGTEDVSERAGGESLQGLQVQEGLDNRLRFRSGDETASYDHVMQEGFTQLREAWQDSMISVRELQRAILRARSEEKDWNTDKNYFEDAYNAENRMHGISRNEDEYYKRNLFDPMMEAFHDFMKHFELSEAEAVRYMVSKTGLERNQFYAFSHGAEQKAKEIIEKKKAELKQQLDDGTIDSKEYLKKQRELDDSLRDEARKIIAAFKDDHEVMRLKDDYQRGIITYAEMLQRLEEIRKSYVKRENPKTDDDGNIVSDNYYDENVRDYSGLSGLLGGERLAEIRAMQDIARSIVDKEKAREMWATINDMIRELHTTTTEAALRTVDAVEVDEDLKERRDNGQIGLIPYLRETEERRKEYSRLWDKINASNAWTLKKSYDSGLLSRNNYEYIKGMFDFYMPLRGWDGTEAHDEYDYVDSPGTAYSPTVVKTHGRLSAADNPLAYIRSMATSAIVSGNKNVMKEHFRRFVMNHPSQLVTLDKQWYERIGTNADGEGVWVARYPDIPENATADEVASIVEAFTEEMRLKAKDGDATQHKGNLRVQYPQTRAEAKEHHVEVVFNGETYVLYINGDPRAAQALNGTRRREAQRRAGESSRAAAFGRWLAANYTSKSPSFTIANLARDITMATAVAAVKENPAYERQLIANLAKLLVPRARRGGAMMPSLMHKYLHGTLDMADDTERYFYEFMTNGGETGFTALQDIDDLKKLMEKEFRKENRRQLDPRRALSALGEFLEYTNRCVEDLTRFATYMASREAGRGVAQSVSDAKNITLNFNRKGTGEKGNATMRNLYVFVNPAVQSLQLLGYLGKHFPKAFTLVTCSWVAAGVLTPLLNELIISMFGGDDDKEVYWSLPDYVRRQNFCLYIPWGVKRFIQIPLAQEFRVFYGLGEATVTFFTGHADFWDSAGDIGKQFLDLLPLDFTGSGGNPVASLMPSAVKPVTDVAFNTSFTGYPIWKDTPWNQDEPAFQKAYSRTPSFLVSASQLINDWTGGNEHLKGVWENTTLGKYANNPAVVQHLMAGYFGGMYTFLTEGGGTLWTIIHGKMPQDMQVPVYNRFINNPKDRTQSGGIRMGDAYWKLMNESKETDSMFRGFKKDTQSQDEAVRKRGEEITAMKDAIEKKAKADSKGEDFESPVKIDKKLERRWLRSQTIKEYNKDIDKQKDMIERHVEDDSIVVQAEANIKAIEAEMVSVLKGM